MPAVKPKLTAIDGDKLGGWHRLCVSGGGYRAMLVPCRAVFRMNELGLLSKLDRVSSVSGGSMMAAALATAWPKLKFNAKGVATNLATEFLPLVHAQAEDSVDFEAGWSASCHL